MLSKSPYSSDSFEQLQTINYYIDVMGDTPTIQNNIIYETKNVNGETTYTGRINEAIYVVDGDTLRFVYEYDVFSNITKITKYINNVVDYVEENTYDIFNQLTKQALTKENVTYSTSYTYDSRGNVTSIIESNETEGDITSSIIFTYNDRNELLTVNDNGTLYTNSYNSNGMLTKYLNWNILYDMRNISFLENPEKIIEFKYNADGVRVSKIIDNTTIIDYTLDGSNIIREKCTGTNNYQIDYYYDSNDGLIGFKYNNLHYMYLKNIQNDIIGIIDSNGDLVVEYMYDAYGNIYNMIDNSGISLGTINPFRYRSYYFDNETGWYYLNSRYYNPKLARFVTMDEIEYLGASDTVLGTNLYLYCENNPINYVDPTGNLSIKRFVVSIPLDIAIWALAGGLSATWATITQPVKAGARKLGTAFIKTTFKKSFLKFLNGFKNVLIKICGKLVPIIKKAIGWFAKKYVASLTAASLAATLIGALTSGIINTILDTIINNITVFLSIGGLVAGLLDWVSDKKLDNKIKLDFWR